MRLNTILAFVLLSSLSVAARADERIRPAGQLLREGYKRTEKPVRGFSGVIPIDEHSLPWPVAFQDTGHSLGNSMAEFQPYDDPPYFHGGCDLRVKSRTPIYAPVKGRLEAGHYSYTTNPDGSMQKFWKPWPQTGSALYFEVATVDANGTRFEVHHIDRASLARPIVDMLNSGFARVEKGALLGNTVYWPDGDYHHIHYNIVLPDGQRVNPEYASPLIADHMAPEVDGIYAVFADGEVRRFGNGQFATAPVEFVAAVNDRQDGNVYVHPPVLASIAFSSGVASLWDFRRLLQGPDGKFPVLMNFFKLSLATPDGQLRTDGGYGTGLSLVRLPVPDGANGEFTIELGDSAGNVTRFNGSVGVDLTQ